MSNASNIFSITGRVAVRQGVCESCKKKAPAYYDLCMERVLQRPQEPAPELFVCEERPDLFSGQVVKRKEISTYRAKMRDILLEAGELNRQELLNKLEITVNQWNRTVAGMPGLVRRRLPNNAIMYSVEQNEKATNV